MVWLFYLVGCSFEFHFVCATIHIYKHLVCNRHQDYCYCKGHCFWRWYCCLPLLLWDSFVLIKQFRFSYHFVFRSVVSVQMYIVCFNSLFCVVIPFVSPATVSYLFRCQLVFKCSQLPRYWHKNERTSHARTHTHTHSKINNSFYGLSLRSWCALFYRKYHFELNDRMPLELCLNNLFRKMIFLRPFAPFFHATMASTSSSSQQPNTQHQQWVIDNWERYSDFPNRHSLEIYIERGREGERCSVISL